MDTWRLVFCPLLCSSFIEIDEKRKQSQFRWVKKLPPSSHPHRVCCFQTHLVIGITWQQQEKSFIKQKGFQRPFSQANGYLIKQTGKDSKCLQNNWIQDLQAHPNLFFMGSLFNCIKAAHHFPRQHFSAIFYSRQSMTDSDKEIYVLIFAPQKQIHFIKKTNSDAPCFHWD